tara:strand:- start:752 stop:2077 length:1326 start_codon:yes stop_codon:yes gene_type:complete
MENKPVKIQSLKVENIKRVQAVSFSLAEDGLTLISGNNAQGKTSVLDAIAFCLGGNRMKPSNLKRDSAMGSPKIKVTLSNGLVVERKGKNSSLTVTDPTGQQSGQTLLNSFISELALDLPKFINSNDKEKAKTLLDIIGVQEQLEALESKEAILMDERKFVGRDRDQKKGHYQDLPEFHGMPEDLLSANDLLEQNKAILQKNAENQNLRDNHDKIIAQGKVCNDTIRLIKNQIEKLEEDLSEQETKKEILEEMYFNSKKSLDTLQDESTAEIEQKIAEIDDINAKVRCNMDKEAAKEEYESKKGQYDSLTEDIESIRKQKVDLLDDADLPLPELSIDAGKLIYKGKNWDCMSSAEQMIVATAIVRKLKPECGFVLMDKLEQLDSDTIKHFNEWLIEEGLQILGTIVGDSDQAQIVIEDGLVAEDRTIKLKPKQPNWKQKRN